MRPRWRIRRVPDGNAGIQIALDSLIRFVTSPEHGTLVPGFLAREAWTTAPAGTRQHAAAIYQAVTDRVLDTPDPPDELVKSPDYLLHEIRTHGRALGDCDDFASLLAACYLEMGYPVRLCVVSQREDRVADHVFCEVLVDGGWAVADPTVPHPVTGIPPAPFGVGLDRSGFTDVWPPAHLT